MRQEPKGHVVKRVEAKVQPHPSGRSQWTASGRGDAHEPPLVPSSVPENSTRVKGSRMARQTNVILIDDIDGSEATTTIRIGWNGQWRELDLNDKNAAAADRALEKYWEAA